MQKKAPQQQPP